MSESKSVFINPLTDFGFKLLFGQSENKELLLSFLNAVINAGQLITDVEFVDKEQINEQADGRALIYDIHCKLADGKKIIVEMQNRYQTFFKDRALYYLSGDIYRQGKKGDGWDYSLTPVYGIFLMNFDWREGEKEHLREDICLMNIRSHKVFSDKLAMTFIKIPLMNKSAEDCRGTLERWIYILKNMDKMEAMPKIFMQDPVFRRLKEVASVAALDSKERAKYEASLKAYRDAYAVYSTASRDGYAAGHAEGLAAGHAEGMAKGEAKGHLEEKVATARKLLAAGLDADFIKEITGLDVKKL